MMTPSHRQTIDHCAHPSLGPGRAVYDNGPAFFLADTGECVPMQKIGMGGFATDKAEGGRRSWIVATTMDGQRVELDTLDRKRGDRHTRIVTYDGRPGWMVSLQGTGAGAAIFRFEPDVGEHELRTWDVAHTGTPEEYKRWTRQGAKAKRDSIWLTYGDFVWRHERDYVRPAEAPKRKAPAKGLAGSPFPPPTATRAQVDAWVAANAPKAEPEHEESMFDATTGESLA